MGTVEHIANPGDEVFFIYYNELQKGIVRQANISLFNEKSTFSLEVRKVIISYNIDFTKKNKTQESVGLSEEKIFLTKEDLIKKLF